LFYGNRVSCWNCKLLSKFYYQQMHKRNALKGLLKFTLKRLQHVSV